MKRKLLFLFGFIIMALILAAACTSSPGYPAPTSSPSAPAPSITIPVPTSSTPTGTITPSAPTGEVTLNISAQNYAFEPKTLGVHMNSKVSLVFNNKDTVPHNFALYSDSGFTKSIFVGEIITGPKTITYTFDAPPLGNYFFRCDVHPQMTGTFNVVQ